MVTKSALYNIEEILRGIIEITDSLEISPRHIEAIGDMASKALLLINEISDKQDNINTRPAE